MLIMSFKPYCWDFLSIQKVFKFDLFLLSMGKVIGVISLKGGVGKTSTVIELGSAIASFGKKVLLVDGNFSAPNLGLHFNLIEPDKTLHHVLDRKIHAKDAVFNVLENVDLLPSSMFYNSEINFFKLKEYLSSLKRSYDYILIDSSPKLDDETLAVMLASDELLVVTTPDHITLATTIKAINKAKSRGVNISGLILNQVHNKNFELSVEDVESVLKVPVLAVIRHNLNLIRAASKFSSMVISNPHNKDSSEFKKLAATLTGEKYSPFSLRNFFTITPKREEINREIFYEQIFG